MLRQLLLCLFGHLCPRKSVSTLSLIIVCSCILISIDLSTSRTVHRRRIGPAGEKSLDEWEDIFHQRGDDDWRLVWHKEKHRRCQHQLLTHMELVCDKDIYKTARRKKRSLEFAPETSDSDEWNKNRTLTFFQDSLANGREAMPKQGFHNKNLFISAQQANRFGYAQLRSILPGEHKRTSGLRRKRGISDECCSGADGCSWEEYAEYCPANVRVRA